MCNEIKEVFAIKKLILLLSIVGFVVCAVFLIVYLSPKTVHIDTTALKSTLASDSNSSDAIIRIQMNGKVAKSKDGMRKFEGIIDIEDEEIPVPSEQRKLTMFISNDGVGSIHYSYFTYSDVNGAVNGIQSYLYGTLIVNDDFSQFVILHNDQHQQSDAMNGIENGYKIIGPANNRAEAIPIFNTLYKR